MTVEQVFQAAVLQLADHFQCLKSRAFISGLRHELPRSLPAGREEAWPQMLALVAGNAAIHEAEAAIVAAKVTDTTAFADLQACHDIMLRTARRCARDLRHANDNIADAELRAMFTERIRLYETVFADLTAYRLELHNTINNLVEEKERMYKDYVAACETIKQLRAQVEGG